MHWTLPQRPSRSAQRRWLVDHSGSCIVSWMGYPNADIQVTTSKLLGERQAPPSPPTLSTSCFLQRKTTLCSVLSPCTAQRYPGPPA